MLLAFDGITIGEKWTTVLPSKSYSVGKVKKLPNLNVMHCALADPAILPDHRIVDGLHQLYGRTSTTASIKPEVSNPLQQARLLWTRPDSFIIALIMSSANHAVKCHKITRLADE